jgi:hypothetical protein
MSGKERQRTLKFFNQLLIEEKITMQTETQKALYYELELITDTVAQAENHSFWGWWTRIWRSLIEALAAENEPQVWSSTDRFGHVWWYVYCPETGRTAQFASAEEARIWLDQNFYSA